MSTGRDRTSTKKASPAAMRLDRLLVYLRFARTRSAACNLIERGALRRNRIPVRRGSEKAAIGDVLTFATGKTVRIVEVLSMPERRGPPAEAQACYRDLKRQGVRELDPRTELPLAAPRTELPGTSFPPFEMKDAQ